MILCTLKVVKFIFSIITSPDPQPLQWYILLSSGQYSIDSPSSPFPKESRYVKTAVVGLIVYKISGLSAPSPVTPYKVPLLENVKFAILSLNGPLSKMAPFVKSKTPRRLIW